MEFEEVKNALVGVIREIQVSSGRSDSGLSDSTRPLSDLQGFDSINAVEASLLLSEKLECDIAPDIGLFASKGRHRSVEEISHELVKIITPTTKPKKGK